MTAVSTAIGRPVDLRDRRAVRWAVRRDAFLLTMSAIGGGAVIGYLVATDRWYLAVVLILAIPTFVLLHRHPLAAVTVWLLLGPLVAVTESGGVRMAYWAVHRGLPAAALLAVVTGRALGLRTTPLPKRGLPEVMMLGYAVVTLLSILYTSDATVPTVFLLYDHIVVPMIIYLLVRLLEPSADHLRRLASVVVFVLVSQSVIGIVSWSAPGLLPAEWLSKLGERTTGSLRAPEVFGTVVLFCGMYLLHLGFSGSKGAFGQMASIALFALSLFMVFMSFSRSVWIAGLSATIGLLWVYRRFVPRLVLVALPIAAIVLGSGLLNQQITYAQSRLDSEESDESALSRLPVMLAAVRMFEAKPLTGWGYENFDRFDRDFQGRVGNIVYAEKDHASHNLYLTTLAEQGLVGIVFFGGPTLIWLRRTGSTWRRLPGSGVISRQLVATLWLSLLAFFVVNNFYRFQFGFAFGMWWLVLGLIASVVDRHRTPVPRPVASSQGSRSQRSRSTS